MAKLGTLHLHWIDTQSTETLDGFPLEHARGLVDELRIKYSTEWLSAFWQSEDGSIHSFDSTFEDDDFSEWRDWADLIETTNEDNK